VKATIDVPDALYRQVKARAALEGRAVREVTIELYTTWLGDRGAEPGRDDESAHADSALPAVPRVGWHGPAEWLAREARV
jgi:hypothetical protein